MSRIKVELLLVLVTLLWGGTFVLIKESLSATSPAAFVVMRFTLASVLGLIIWHRSLAALTPRLVWQGLLLGVLFGGGFLLQSMGLTETSATASAFITGTTVVFVPFMYRLIERRSVTLLNWVSTLAVLCGLYLFT
jgi:drug/metabolite transporter (DMT)-like permease